MGCRGSVGQGHCNFPGRQRQEVDVTWSYTEEGRVPSATDLLIILVSAPFGAPAAENPMEVIIRVWQPRRQPFPPRGPGLAMESGRLAL